jgi:hypothetical protein
MFKMSCYVNKSMYLRWKLIPECIEVIFMYRESKLLCVFIFNLVTWLFPPIFNYINSKPWHFIQCRYLVFSHRFLIAWIRNHDVSFNVVTWFFPRQSLITWISEPWHFIQCSYLFFFHQYLMTWISELWYFIDTVMERTWMNAVCVRFFITLHIAVLSFLSFLCLI